MTIRGCASQAGTVTFVPYDVRISRAGPRMLAAARTATTRLRLEADIVLLLDMVWPVVREQGVATGHNVVMYDVGEGGTFTVDAGVEVFDDFADRGEVRHVSTPSGDVVTTAHYGVYSAVGPAYAMLGRVVRGQRARAGWGELGGLW
jgi:hypothetical protein